MVSIQATASHNQAVSGVAYFWQIQAYELDSPSLGADYLLISLQPLSKFGDFCLSLLSLG